MATDIFFKHSGILCEEFTVEQQGKGTYTVELAAVDHCQKCLLDPQCSRMSLKFKDGCDSRAVKQRKSAWLLPAILVLQSAVTDVEDYGSEFQHLL